MFELKKHVCLAIVLLFLGTGQTVSQDSIFQFDSLDTEVISDESMTNDEKIIYISDLWKFQSGDNLEWSAPDYDDSDWSVVSTNLTQADLAFADWDGIGWFRKQLTVVPNLVEKPMALLIDRHLGASEIYLNGEKIHELGRFSTDASRVEAYSGNLPLVIFFPDREIHTLAVRFINPSYVETGRVFGNNGFRILLGDWEANQNETLAFISRWTGITMFYAGILLTFALIHFLLFVFYPKEKRNIYFSLFTGGLTLITYLLYKLELANYTIESLLFYRSALFFEILILAFAVRFVHSVDRDQNPLYSNILLAIGFTAAVVIFFYPSELIWLREIILIGFVIEILRTLFVMFGRKRPGIWVVGVGVLTFVIGLMVSIMINFNLLDGDIRVINMAGSGMLILSMSVFLSREVAATQKRLENKLQEVQELSEMALEQEKINKEREIEKRLLEAENERKSRELEEARALQLSMLPKKLPDIDPYDIAVYMETANEVGGDYYDYSIGSDRSMTLAVGDATGHGLKAGIMVAAAKSYFHTLVGESDPLTVLSRMSSGIRNLDMRMMYMGLMLVKCKGYRAEIATAGMPPALHYCKKSGTVQEIVLKGLPLGTQVNYPYQNRIIDLEPGDCLLLMSDGLMELFNEDRDILGLEKIKQMVVSSADDQARDIINRLEQTIETWSGNKKNEDDITIMAVKIKER